MPKAAGLYGEKVLAQVKKNVAQYPALITILYFEGQTKLKSVLNEPC